MFLSNPAKSLLAFILLLFSAAGCGFLQTGENTPAPLVPEAKSRFPFETKEPENFQCEIIAVAGETSRRTLLARKGNWRRTDFDAGEKNHRAVLQTDKEYLIAFDQKVYAERPAKTGTADADAEQNDFTQMQLNRVGHAEFEEIGREGRIVRYKVMLENSGPDEILIYFDESAGMPVKQEFFSVNGEEKTLQYSVEIVNFRTDVDEGLFAIPAGFRKVSLSEFF